MASPKLTIGIPTRNRSTLVSSLVRSCLSQTEPVFEIIVSDNASDDDTFVKLSQLNHPSLIVLRQTENIGMVGNWNKCLERCSGDWFVLLSDDDRIDPDFYQHAIRAIDSAADADLLIMRCRIVDNISNQMNLNFPPIHACGRVDFLRDIFPAWLRHQFTLPLAGFIFRANILKSSGGFSKLLPFAADVATWLPIAFHNNCAFWPEDKIDYIVHVGMTTRTFDFETLVLDALKMHNLILSEIERCSIIVNSRRDFVAMANKHLKIGFGNMMIISARAGKKKSALIGVWLKYVRRIPDFGITALSLAAIVTPAFMFDIVGWPYRAWLALKRRARRHPPVLS